MSNGATPAPPGWYRDPGSADPAARRWWSGSAWTANVAIAQPVPIAGTVAFDKRKHNLQVVTGVFEGLTALWFIATYVLHIGAVAFDIVPIAITTLILEINLVSVRRRVDGITKVGTVLQLLSGIIGVGWVVAISIVATVMFIAQHSG
jgi:hypothetical protein